jgi:hypothetical protein
MDIRRARLWASAVLSCGIALFGCNGSGDNTPPAEQPPAETAPTAQDTTPIMITPPGQPVNGREAFISIGGVIGRPHAAALQALITGYQRAGFRVHFVVSAMSFDPFAVAMADVAREYRTAGRGLEYVVFHHTGHGWDDHISYETPTGQRGSTTHQEIAVGLGVLFPKTVLEFRQTMFGLVYDACGQGKAVQHKVRGRSGFIATSTPDAAPAALCTANSCNWICDNCWTQTAPAYTYSERFGPNLGTPPTPDLVDEAAQAAHNSGQLGLVNASSPSGCTGKFERY